MSVAKDVPMAAVFNLHLSKAEKKSPTVSCSVCRIFVAIFAGKRESRIFWSLSHSSSVMQTVLLQLAIVPGDFSLMRRTSSIILRRELHLVTPSKLGIGRPWPRKISLIICFLSKTDSDLTFLNRFWSCFFTAFKIASCSVRAAHLIPRTPRCSRELT